ncbi:MAG: YgcG family protein [Limnobacter sp.]|nr:YgcG family protein [Limnobacter sp.]
MTRLLAVLLLGFTFCTGTFAQDGLVLVPALKARVTDLTATLTPEQKSSLEQTLQEFETRKGSQIAVLLVPTTQPEAIEQYALRVVEQWKLGRNKVDDGVLFLIAKNDRRMRIEVGYGLEGGLNDAVAKRIIAEIVTPSFKNGDFFGGVQAGVTAIVGAVDGETLTEPSRTVSNAAGGDGFSDTFVGVLFGAVFVGNFLRSLLGPLIAGLITAVVLAPVIWFLQGSMLVSLIASAFAGLIVLVGIRSGGGGGSGGRFGSGRSSGGGFGGGGGRFGGGGASGGW